MSEPSFNELRTAYVNGRRGEDKADKTFAGYKYSIDRYERFLTENNIHYTDIDQGTDISIDLENHNTTTISDKNLLDYFVMWMIHDEGYAKSTVQTTYNYVQPFIKFLLREDYIEYDAPDATTLSQYITYGTTIQKEKWNEDYVAITPEQFEQIIENTPAPKFRNKLILTLLYTTGMRRAELAELKLNDINLNNREIQVPPVKTDNSRKVWFNQSIKTKLDIWINGGKRDGYYNSDSDFLFVTNDSRSQGGITPKRVSKIFQKAASCLDDQDYYIDKEGRKRWKYSTHSTRHGFAEKFIRNTGESGIYELTQILGHSSVSQTEKYLESEKDEFLRSQMLQHSPKT